MSDPKNPEDEASRPPEERAATTEKPGREASRPAKKERRSRGPRRRAAAAPSHPLHKGKIVEIKDGQAFVELGPRVKGVIPLADFEPAPQVGQEYEFALDSIKDDVWSLSRKEAHLREIWSSLTPGKEVHVRVIGQNAGGLEVKIGPVSAFLPSSHVDLHPARDLTEYFGRELDAEVLEVNKRRRRVVVSRRALLHRAMNERRREAIARLREGDVVTGKVEKLQPFGAIVALSDGLSGLLHVSNISYQRVNDPASVLSLGQEVQVQVLEIKKEGQRIGLGMKQLATDPWAGAASTFPEESRHKGKVTRLTDFGAFVELCQGVEGLIHISQVSRERIEKVSDALKVGEEIQVRVLSVAGGRRRISLSRLNAAGALLGSAEDKEAGEEDDGPQFKSFREPPAQRGTNLGSVLRKALEGK